MIRKAAYKTLVVMKIKSQAKFTECIHVEKFQILLIDRS